MYVCVCVRRVNGGKVREVGAAAAPAPDIPADDSLLFLPPRTMSNSSNSKKRDIKSFFTTHYGSGSGSDSESGEEEQEDHVPDKRTTAGDGIEEGEEDGTGSRADDDFSDEGTSDQLLSPKEFHNTLKGLPSDQIKIPKRNKGSVDPLIAEKLERLKYTKETHGRDMKYEIQKRKDFRNPSIYEKLIDHCHIREFGSNFPTDVFDPDAFEPGSYYEELSKAQKVLMDSITEKEKESHPKVEIVHAVAKKGSSSATSLSSDPSRKKRSKWDEGPAPKKVG